MHKGNKTKRKFLENPKIWKLAGKISVSERTGYVRRGKRTFMEMSSEEHPAQPERGSSWTMSPEMVKCILIVPSHRRTSDRYVSHLLDSSHTHFLISSHSFPHPLSHLLTLSPPHSHLNSPFPHTHTTSHYHFLTLSPQLSTSSHTHHLTHSTPQTLNTPPTPSHPYILSNYLLTPSPPQLPHPLTSSPLHLLISSPPMTCDLQTMLAPRIPQGDTVISRKAVKKC